MDTIYGNISNQTINEQKKYLYGSIINLLYLREEGYELLDQRIQTLINQVYGSLKLFNNTPEILSIIAWLEDARVHPEQFRKNVLDAANMVDRLGGEFYV
jgi:hypothetical protein